MLACPKIAHMINLVSDFSTLKKSTRKRNSPGQVVLGNHDGKFDIIISRVTYYTIELDVVWGQ